MIAIQGIDRERTEAQTIHRRTKMTIQKWPRILLLAMLPIGDTIWLAPTTRALRMRYPAARMTALAYPSNAPVAALLPGVDEVAQFEPPRGLERASALPRLLATLYDCQYDWAITFTSPAFKWISLLAGIPRRTYMKFDPLWWLIPARHDDWRATHATEHYYNAARELGLPPWREIDQRPTLALPTTARQEARRFLRARQVEQRGERHGERRLVALHPGGAGLNGQKRWPAESFAVLARRLAREGDARIMVMGGPDEVELARHVARLAHEAYPIVAAGATSLLGSLALVERADLFIGDDSSLLHAAAALGVPYIGLFGPTSPASFRPVPTRPGQGRLLLARGQSDEPIAFVGSDVVWKTGRCVGAPHAMERIRVDDVLLAAAQALADSTAPPAAMPRAEEPHLEPSSSVR